MIIGSVGSVLMGGAFPLFLNISGRMIDSFIDGTDIMEQAKGNMINYFYLSIGALLVGSVMNACWNLSAEFQVARCRK